MIGTVFVVAVVVCGVIAAAIASAKNRSMLGWFLLGALLGLIGVLIVALLPSEPPPAPLGMRMVRCTRCNAVQNIAIRDSAFECWQCKHSNEVAVIERHDGSRTPEDTREWLNRVKKEP